MIDCNCIYGRCEQIQAKKEEIERLQARVEALEGELLLMDETIRNSLKYVGLAATEQVESDD